MKDNESQVKYQYLVIVRIGDDNYYFPSNSRNSIKQMEENKGTYCWVYDKDGFWLSYAAKDKQTGRSFHPRMFPDGEPRERYAEMLREFNRKAVPLDEKIQAAQMNSPVYRSFDCEKKEFTR